MEPCNFQFYPLNTLGCVISEDKNSNLISKLQKVRDHCHYTGKYRGVTHSICNLKFNLPNKIIVVFHNSSNFDYHFIIKKLANEFK